MAVSSLGNSLDYSVQRRALSPDESKVLPKLEIGRLGDRRRPVGVEQTRTGDELRWRWRHADLRLQHKRGGHGANSRPMVHRYASTARVSDEQFGPAGTGQGIPPPKSTVRCNVPNLD